MDFITFAREMYPCWILGILVILMVIKSGNGHVLRIEKRPLIRWFLFLCVISIIRIFILKIYYIRTSHGSPLPLGVAPTVFWEDCLHGLPVFILSKLIGKEKKWARIVNFLFLFTISFAFGAGHLYQGLVPAILLSFYVRYSVEIGERRGFGTVMIGHMLYDFMTILVVQYFL